MQSNQHASRRPEPPEWVRAALEGATALRYVFQNFFGEAWFAEIDAGGNVELVGQDIDWTSIRIPADQVQAELALQRAALCEPTASRPPLAGQWILNDSERAWVLSVLMVATQQRPQPERAGA